jgi:hypothetical protein
MNFTLELSIVMRFLGKFMGFINKPSFWVLYNEGSFLSISRVFPEILKLFVKLLRKLFPHQILKFKFHLKTQFVTSNKETLN